MPQGRKKKETLVNLPKNIDRKIGKRPKWDVIEAMRLKYKNKLSFDSIGAIYGVTGQAIEQGIKRVWGMVPDIAEMKAFEHNKPLLLTMAEQKILGKIVDDKVLQKASLNNLAYSLQNIHNINRLEQGKSTENLNIRSQVGYIAGEIERLQAKEVSMSTLDVVLPPDSEDVSEQL